MPSGSQRPLARLKKKLLSASFVRASVCVYLKHYKIILSFFRCLESSPLPPVRPPKNPSLLRNHMFALSIVIFRSKSPLWTRGFWLWFFWQIRTQGSVPRREICIILFIEYFRWYVFFCHALVSEVLCKPYCPGSGPNFTGFGLMSGSGSPTLWKQKRSLFKLSKIFMQ